MLIVSLVLYRLFGAYRYRQGYDSKGSSTRYPAIPAACHKANIERKYIDAGGKVVASNRNKAIEQKTDSLVEYRINHSEAEVSQLAVKPHFPQYKDMRRPMPGSLVLHNGNVFVLTASDGRHNGFADYYIDEYGEKHGARKCNVLTNNTGLQFCG